MALCIVILWLLYYKPNSFLTFHYSNASMSHKCLQISNDKIRARNFNCWISISKLCIPKLIIKVDSFKEKITIKILNSTFEWRQWLGCETYWIFPLLKHDTMVIYSLSISFNRGKIQKWCWKHILFQIYVSSPPPFKRIILFKKTLYQKFYGSLS